MSTSIDERVVYMKFDNKNFENNAQDSLRTLDKLKSSLDFKDVQSKLNNVDLSGLKRSMGSMFDNVDSSKMLSAIDKLEYRMSTLGQFTGRIVQNVADDIYSVIKRALSGIDQVVDYASSGIIQGGYRRASNIQTAKFQLEGLGISWNEIKDDIDFAVTNTAYSLDQAALVAANLTTAGLRPGKEWVDLSGNLRNEDLLAMVLRSISGTAASTGGRSDYSDIGRILTQMVSLGKVNQQQLNELSYRGIAANDVVAEYFSKIAYQGRTDWTAADIREITGSRDNTLSPYVVIEALYEKFGEHAVKANETLSGVMANTKSALARIGENFFEPIIENNGPLVHAFEVLRQSINGLNTAIKPVISAFGKDVAGVIGKFADNFLDKTLVVDEEGNAVLDSNGKEQYTYSLKKKGGLFSDFVEDLYIGEWKEKAIPGLSDHTYVDFDGEVTTRAAIIAENLRASAMNFMETISLISTAVGDAIHAVFPNADGLAETLVKITTKIREITDAWKNSRFLKDGGDWQKSDLYHIIRGIASGIDIIFRFGSSFKKHIIDPIFNKGKEAAEKSGLWDYFVGFFDSIYEFDQKIKNFDGDYFGPFFEKIKEIFGKIRDIVQKGFKFISDKFEIIKPKLVAFFDFIKPKVKSAFNSIVNWWKPVKDILVNSDLSIQEKWDAIKKYFKDNFEIPGMDKLRSLRDFFSEHFDMPGWDNVKDFFSTIGDTIGKGWEKVKEIFGFGKKEDPTLTVSNGGLSGSNGILYGSAGKIASNFTISEAINNLDTSTEKMPTISERIKNFFTSIGDTFKGFDIDGVNAVLIAFAGAFVVGFAAIAYVVYKVFKTLSFVVFGLPGLVEKLLGSFNELINGISDTMRASRIEMYSNTFRNVAESIAILAGVFLAISAFVLLVDVLDPSGSYVDKLTTVATTIGIITVVFGVIIAALGAYADTVGKAVTITKAGLNIVTTTATFASIAAIISAMVTGIVIISAVIFALSFMDTKDFISGLWKLVVVAGILVGATIALMALGKSLGKMQSISGYSMSNGSKISKNLFINFAGIAAIISAITVGLVVLTGLIAVYAYLFTDWKKFLAGIGYLTVVGGLLIGLTAAVFLVVRLIENIDIKREISTPKLIGLFLGMAAILGAITVGVLLLSGVLIILSKVASSDLDAFESGIAALVVIGGMIVGIPTLLMFFNKNTMQSDLRAGNLLKMAGSVVVLSAAALIMAKALSLVGNLDTGSVLVSAAAISGIMLACMLLTGILVGIANSDVDNGNTGLFAVYGIALMLAALYPVALAIEKISQLNPGQYIAGIGGVIGILVAVGGLALILNKFAKDIDIKNVVGAAGGMAMMAVALIPVAAALGLLFVALDGRDIDATAFGMAITGIFFIFAEIAAAVGILSNVMPKDFNWKSMLSTAGTMVLLSAALIPIIGSVALLILVLNKAPNVSPWMVISILGGISAAIIALSAGAMFISAAATRQLTETNSGAIKQLAKVLFMMIGGFAAITATLGLFVLAMHSFDVSGTEMGMAVGLIGTMTILITALGMWMNKVANNQQISLMSNEKYANMFKSIGVVIAAVLACASAIAIVNSTGVSGLTSLSNAGAVIIAMGGVIAAVAVISLMAKSKLFGVSDLETLAPMLISVGVVAGATFVLAGAIVLLNRFTSGNIWNTVLVLAAIAGGVAGIAALMALIAKIKYDPDRLTTLVKGMVKMLGIIAGFVAVLLVLNAFSTSGIWESLAILGIISGGVVAMSALFAVIAMIPFDPDSMKWLIVALTGSVLSIIGLGAALTIVSDMSWKEIASKLAVFVAAIGILALGIALLGLIPDAESSWASMGIMLLGLGVAMAGAGALLYLAAKSFTEFTDTLTGLNDKGDELKGGMAAWTTALVTGFVNGLHEFNLQWPNIQREISTFLNQLFPWLETTLKQLVEHLKTQIGTIIGALADLINDPQIQNDLARIIQGLLDWIENHIEDWSAQLVRIGAKIVTGIAKGIVYGVPGPTGQTISEWIDGIVNKDYNKHKKSQWSEVWREQITESLHDAYISMGYLEEEWNKIASSADFMNLVDMMISDAIDNGSLDISLDEYFRELSEIAEAQGSYLPTDIRSHHISGKNISDLLGLVPEEYRDEVQEYFDAIQEAFANGGDWQGSIDDLSQFLNEMLKTVDDENLRAAIYEAAEKLGINLNNGSSSQYTPWIVWAMAAMGKWKSVFSDEQNAKDVHDSAVSIMGSYIQGSLEKLQMASLTDYTNSVPYLIGKATVLAQKIGMLEQQAADGDSWAQAWLEVYRMQMIGVTSEIKEAAADQATEAAESAKDATKEEIEKDPIVVEPKITIDPIFGETHHSGIKENTNKEDDLEAQLQPVAEKIAEKSYDTVEEEMASKNWRKPGEDALNGLFDGFMEEQNLVARANKAAEAARQALNTALRSRQHGFDEHSPAVWEGITVPGVDAIAGLFLSMQGAAPGFASETSEVVADTTSVNFSAGLDEAVEKMDFEGFANDIIGKAKEKLPSMSDLLSDFSIDKGVAGNIEAFTNIFTKIKDAFADTDLSVPSIFGSLKDRVLSALGIDSNNDLGQAITDGLSNALGIDLNSIMDGSALSSDLSLESLGVNIDMSGTTFDPDANGFGGWDANDWMSNNTIDIDTNIDLDQQVLDDFLNQNTTLGLANSVPVAGGYRQSTIGSTYVNNYSYNQTNNSPTALNTREINRQNELLLNRRRRG